MAANPEGFATGGKDGKLSLWNKDFTPVVSFDLTRTSKGYKGIASNLSKLSKLPV